MTSSSLDFDNPQPPYRQVAEGIRAAINSGELPVGEKLKSIRDLAREYEVSPGTVQQALRLLREEGVVTTWQGRGTFVRSIQPQADRTLTGSEIIEHLDTVLSRLEHLEGRVTSLEKSQRKPARPRDNRPGE